jgi:hypothetical protein
VKELGLESVVAVDLSGIADPKVVADCSMGEITSGIDYSPKREPEVLLEPRSKAFATKNKIAQKSSRPKS